MTTVHTAMILAAGFGTRMRPLTLETPKPLLPVYNIPLIEWHIYAIKKAGITNIVINCAWLAEKLMQSIGDGSKYGVTISWSKEDEVLETAGGIRKALELLGQSPFLLVNGDVWTTADYKQVLVNAHKTDADAYLCLVDNPEHNPSGDFLLVDGNIQTKTDETQGLTFSGISVLKPSLFMELEQGKKEPLAPVLRNAMIADTTQGEKLMCDWVDVGTPARLTELDERIRTHGAQDHPAWSFINKS